MEPMPQRFHPIPESQLQVLGWIGWGLDVLYLLIPGCLIILINGEQQKRLTTLTNRTLLGWIVMDGDGW